MPVWLLVSSMHYFQECMELRYFLLVFVSRLLCNAPVWIVVLVGSVRYLTRKPPYVSGAEATRPKAALPELGARGLLAGVLIVIAPSSSCGHVLPALVYQQVALGPSLHFIGVQDPGVLPQHIHVRLFTDTFVGSADESRLTAFNFNSLL